MQTSRHGRISWRMMLAAALCAAPALAATAEGPDIAVWLTTNTDQPVSQIAIVGPEHVFSLERLGSPIATGKVIALVRAEAISADWGTAHGFQCLEARLLFDGEGRRMRQIRSATFPERSRAALTPRHASWF